MHVGGSRLTRSLVEVVRGKNMPQMQSQSLWSSIDCLRIETIRIKSERLWRFDCSNFHVCLCDFRRPTPDAPGVAEDTDMQDAN